MGHSDMLRPSPVSALQPGSPNCASSTPLQGPCMHASEAPALTDRIQGGLRAGIVLGWTAQDEAACGQRGCMARALRTGCLQGLADARHIYQACAEMLVGRRFAHLDAIMHTRPPRQAGQAGWSLGQCGLPAGEPLQLPGQQLV